MHALYPVYERGSIFNEEFLRSVDQSSPFKIINNLFDCPKTACELDRLTYLDTKLALIDNDLQGKIGKIAQILGLTVRYPMLDTQLWELGCSIPSGLKLKGFNKKHIFKEAFKNFLPREIIVKKKHGFGLPFAVWLRKDVKLRQFVKDVLISSGVQPHPYFKKGIFEKLLKMHDKEPSPYYGDILWLFLLLEIWRKEWAR